MIKVLNNVSAYLSMMLGVVRFLCFMAGVDFFYIGKIIFLE
jgi:hypothetical protein